jgi:hypothetical protein
MNVFLTGIGCRDSTVRFYRPNSVRNFLWIWMKSEVYKRRVNVPLASFSRILDAAARRKGSEVQLIRTAREIRTRVAKCIEVDGGVFEHLL